MSGPQSSREDGKIISEGMTEKERQAAYLNRLPEGYRYPMFNGRIALESQANNGYKGTDTALRELIDNSIEAGAKNIWIATRCIQSDKRKKGKSTTAVSSIATIDDGPGMQPNLLRFALSWGGGTHTDDPTSLGKFGFGLPNSSINQSRKFTVYSKTADGPGWQSITIDIEQFGNYDPLEVPPAKSAELPEWVVDYLKRQNVELTTGTIVVWEAIRREKLSFIKRSRLVEHLLNDFGAVYCHFLGRQVSITIDDKSVQATDPLFVTPGARFYLEPEQGGAEQTWSEKIVAKVYRNQDGALDLEWVDKETELEAAIDDPEVKIVTMEARVAKFHKGFALGHKSACPPGDLTPWHRFGIRRPRKGLSILRANREIEVIQKFPYKEGEGWGKWPTALQAYALHWGAELRYSDPVLDDLFGVTNNKQGATLTEPIWKILAKAKLDAAMGAASSAVTQERKKEEKQRRQQPALNDPDQPNAATTAAGLADTLIGPPKLSDEDTERGRVELEDEVEAEASATGASIEEARKAVRDRKKKKPYKVDFHTAEGGVFYVPSTNTGLQTVVSVNRAHPFYEQCYERLGTLDDPKPRETLDLLLIALARAEVRDGSPVEVYEAERTYQWSSFLDTALKALDRTTEDERDYDLNNA